MPRPLRIFPNPSFQSPPRREQPSPRPGTSPGRCTARNRNGSVPRTDSRHSPGSPEPGGLLKQAGDDCGGAAVEAPSGPADARSGPDVDEPVAGIEEELAVGDESEQPGPELDAQVTGSLRGEPRPGQRDQDPAQ